ncbi:MAG: YdcF family protein [Clostridia bacterium]|nr:YdcF family protein [Clostridia bacterium]
MVKKTGRWVGLAAAVLLAADALVTMRIRIHTGNVVLLALAAAAIAALLFPAAFAAGFRWLRARRGGRIALRVVCAAAAALVLLFATVSACMIGACCRTPDPQATVVVLGAGLRGEQPSRILHERLRAAAEYLLAHPQAACVVTGGQGADEAVSEASVMRRILVSYGIEESRIYAEEDSQSTYENLQNTAELIRRHGLCEKTAVVTQGFHQLRGQSFARQAGLTETGAVVAPTPLYQLLPYWIREFAGVCHMVLLGR